MHEKYGDFTPAQLPQHGPISPQGGHAGGKYGGGGGKYGGAGGKYGGAAIVAKSELGDGPLSPIALTALTL